MPEITSQVSVETEQVFEGYRRWGYLAANLDPLGFLTPIVHPELIVDGDAAVAARKFYCGTIGTEFEHIDDPVRRRWICEKLESIPQEPDRAYILERLVRSELFEQVLQARYLGSKRFSLEGVNALIPLLDRVLDAAAQVGTEQIMLGMSHRGRLNVMAHVAGQTRRGYFRGLRGCGPAQRARQRRREVPRRRHRRVSDARRAKAQRSSCFESEPFGSGRSRCHWTSAREADARR
jgi:2-oxoglutarate dehydrogenase E1 component